MTPTPRILAGIDEAGLGPILGPLVMGWSAFRVGDELDLWKALAPSVSAEPGKDAERLVVTDSKLVYTRNPRGEKRLERTALAFLGTQADAPKTARELLLRTPAGLRRQPSLATRDIWTRMFRPMRIRWIT